MPLPGSRPLLQRLARRLFVRLDRLVLLDVISAPFDLLERGSASTYAIIVRERFAPSAAAARIGTVPMFTMLGMAPVGWMSGNAFDLPRGVHRRLRVVSAEPG